MSRQRFERIAIGCARNSTLGDNRRDISGRRHVERRILYGSTVGRNRYAEDMRDLGRRPLLDGNLVAGSERKVERGNRRGYKKRHAVLLRQNGKRIRPDFVGYVTVPGNTVRAHDHAPDPTALQEMSG